MIEELNSKILIEWEDKHRKLGLNCFAADGIMYRGAINVESTCREKLGNEEELWEKAPIRIAFITKDQVAESIDGEYCSHDVRQEVGFKNGKPSRTFHANLMNMLYALVKTTDTYLPAYNEAITEAIKYYEDYPFARVNVKKQAGGATCPDSALDEFLEKDKDFILRQIQNLDADILVCCGSKNYKNRILNFLIENCYKDAKIVPDSEGWLYYDSNSDKLLVDTWHPSSRIRKERLFSELSLAYHNFLKNHMEFNKKR